MRKGIQNKPKKAESTAKPAKAPPNGGVDSFNLTTCLLSCLNEREQDILKRRHALTGRQRETLEGIGQGYQITRERVRQIERASLNKIKRLVDYRAVLQGLIDEIDQMLAKFGQVISHEHLIEELAEIQDKSDVDYHRERTHLRFLLEQFIPEFFHFHNEGDLHLPGWSRVKEYINPVKEILVKLENFLSKYAKPLTYEQIAQHLSEPVDSMYSYLHLSKNIDRNAFGLWGMNDWAAVNPKRMADRIYLVLAKYGEPLHYQDIAGYIEKHYGKKTHPPTVHNELIADSRFVLVGRGIYALKEWGYQAGTVKDVVAAILAKSEEPLSRDTIVEMVQKQRLVARSTILLALNSDLRVKRVGKDKYQFLDK